MRAAWPSARRANSSGLEIPAAIRPDDIPGRNRSLSPIRMPLMQQPATQRRLAAILAPDVVAFSRMMGADEEGTLARLKRVREEPTHPAVVGFPGPLFKDPPPTPPSGVPTVGEPG